MPGQSTLTSPLGTPVYAPGHDDRDVFAGTSRVSRIVPLVVGGIGAAIIAGGVILYAAGVIGAPVLNPTEDAPAMEPRWEPNPEFSKALGVQALRNLDANERTGSKMPQPDEGSLLPPEQPPSPPGVTVSPARPEDAPERELWQPPVSPKAPEGTEDLPKAADPKRTPPNGYADDPRR